MHVFIIDTDSYAGNFERELCAYMTGMFGDCEVGADIAEEVQADLVHAHWYLNHVEDVADDRGCFRPCQIELTPAQAHQYNSVGINMDSAPPAEVLEELKARSAAYFAADYRGGEVITITGFRLRTVTVAENEVTI